MKAHLLALLMLCVVSSFALAQSTQKTDSSYNDPQVSAQNYKHPNKAAEAIKSGKEKPVKAGKVEVAVNSNYKQTFKRSTTHKSKVATETPESKKRVKRNYKNQF